MRQTPSFAGCALGCVGLLLVTVVGTVLGYEARSGWLPTLAYALNVAPELRSADVIIVLGGSGGDREDYGSQLYRQGLARYVIATGAPIGTTAEANRLIAHGVPSNALFLAYGTQNTHEDALSSRELMRQHGWHTALLVTDPFHIRRSLWTFDTAFADQSLRVWPAPVVGGWFQADHWWKSEDGFVAVNDEYLKLAYYLARGYIAPSVVVTGR